MGAEISTHAPVSDNLPLSFQLTHPARGATTLDAEIYAIHITFQLTHPVRGATCRFHGSSLEKRFQLTYPARGATNFVGNTLHHAAGNFNPRTPRGATALPGVIVSYDPDFNSHTPRGVRRLRGDHKRRGLPISTHTPREGCDGTAYTKVSSKTYFNSHTPRGVRPSPKFVAVFNNSDFNSRTPRGVRPLIFTGLFLLILVFQLTHPARGATISSTYTGTR